MKNITAILTIFFFLAWIFPLGAFIKPSEEEKVCNGRRAVCLCSHLVKKQLSKKAASMLLKSGGSSNKEAAGPGGASHYYLLASASLVDGRRDISFLFHQQEKFYTNPAACSIEHVPRA